MKLFKHKPISSACEIEDFEDFNVQASVHWKWPLICKVVGLKWII